MENVKIQKFGEDLIFIIPKDVCDKLDIKEGTQMDIETFTCCGEIGARLKVKTV